MEGIDIGRCEDGMMMVYVGGIANSENRKALIAEAIELINTDPANAMVDEFLGFKNYAAFGDQRCDCSYGMGPRHGSIVFEIGRHRKFEGPIHKNAIYYLECERDFVPLEVESKNSYSGKTHLNLYQTITRWRKHVLDAEELENYLKKQRVDSVLLEVERLL